jgi:hypothetical protein
LALVAVNCSEEEWPKMLLLSWGISALFAINWTRWGFPEGIHVLAEGRARMITKKMRKWTDWSPEEKTCFLSRKLFEGNHSSVFKLNSLFMYFYIFSFPSFFVSVISFLFFRYLIYVQMGGAILFKLWGSCLPIRPHGSSLKLLNGFWRNLTVGIYPTRKC